MWSLLIMPKERVFMAIKNRSQSLSILAICAVLSLSCVPMNAFSLRDARELCKRHRFIILAALSAPVIYMYTQKLITRAIQDYKNRNTENPEVKSSSTQEYAEGLSDAFIKITKLVGTISKVFRAVSCPDEGKIAGDQWLDDISQMA